MADDSTFQPIIDPTFQLIEPRDTFTTERPAVETPSPFRSTSLPLTEELTFYQGDLDALDSRSVQRLVYINEFTLRQFRDRYRQALEQIDRNGWSLSAMIEQVGPRVGHSIFRDASAVTLANLDAVFGLSGHIGGFFALQTTGLFNFCSIGGAPGGFSEYLQWRRPEAEGIAMSLRDRNWNREAITAGAQAIVGPGIDRDRLTIVYGPDETGNVITNADWLRGLILRAYPEGLDLFLGQAWPSPKTSERLQPLYLARILIAELLVALTSLRIGGSLVLRVDEAMIPITAQLIGIVTQAFEKVWLIKPLASQPLSPERYLVAKGRRSDVQALVELLRKANQATVDVLPTNLVSDLPSYFTAWLQVQNNADLERRFEALERLERLIESFGYNQPVDRSSLYHALTYWNLPGNHRSVVS